MFEHIKKSLNTRAPSVPTSHPKMLAPLTPQIPAVGNNDQINPNYIGSGRPQRFKKIKSMFGL